ncbi:hypothetical protein D7X94_01845 [Acutalibacter sp. 1XD8-33]|uniref:hypothetical protein n=1 Tax=Acutalibacter sp. 1XD8-33 TaxID=2320081 RepID=UPI000EA2A346|nr:hypothetical protein [Acutalibacter sp. 1XD8-33]RKJ42242.1 hypothetical protein D7X94_01845 [Acutalibacter sp. 1XD8-33]
MGIFIIFLHFAGGVSKEPALTNGKKGDYNRHTARKYIFFGKPDPDGSVMETREARDEYF